jgi:hypothetical protein
VPGRGPEGGAQLCALPVRAVSAMYGATLPLLAGVCALWMYNAARLWAASRSGAKLRRANVRLIGLGTLALATWCAVWALKAWDPATFVVMKHPVCTVLYCAGIILLVMACVTLVDMYEAFVRIRVAMLPEGLATARFAAMVHGARAERIRRATTVLVLVENVPALLGLVAHSAYIEPMARLAVLLKGGTLFMLVRLRFIPLISFVVSDLSEATSGLHGMSIDSDTLRRADLLLERSRALLMVMRVGFALCFPVYLICALSPAVLSFFWVAEFGAILLSASASVPACMIFDHTRACESRSHTVLSTQHSHTVLSTQHSLALVGSAQHSVAIAGRRATAVAPLSAAPLGRACVVADSKVAK